MFEKLLQDLQAVLKEMADMLSVKKGLQDEISRLEQENVELKEEINKHVCETPKCDHTQFEQEIERLMQELAKLEQEKAALEDEKANHKCPEDRTEELEKLQKEAEGLRNQVVALEKYIEDYLNDEAIKKEMEVLANQITSLKAEKEAQEKKHQEELTALQAEVNELKKLLMTN
jgi:chromosome segregation ATPase